MKVRCIYSKAFASDSDRQGACKRHWVMKLRGRGELPLGEHHTASVVGVMWAFNSRADHVGYRNLPVNWLVARLSVNGGSDAEGG